MADRTPLETTLIAHLRWLVDERLKPYGDKQYGKGETRKLLERIGEGDPRPDRVPSDIFKHRIMSEWTA